MKFRKFVDNRVARRLHRAGNLFVGFVGLKVLILGVIPPVYWLLKLVRTVKQGQRAGDMSDIALLVLSYSIVGFGVYIWKFVEAGGVLNEEDQILNPRKQYFNERIAIFSASELDALAKIVITGAARAGSTVYNNLDAAGFIERDFTGVYRLNKRFDAELENWLKNRKDPS